jgi:hypothetical protein
MASSSSENYSVEDYAKFAREFIWGDDPRVEAAVLEQRIVQMEQAARNTNIALLRSYYESQLVKLRAQLGAIQRQASEQQYAADTNKAIRIVTIVAGLGLVGFFAATAYRQIQESTVAQARRRKIESSLR